MSNRIVTLAVPAGVLPTAVSVTLTDPTATTKR